MAADQEGVRTSSSSDFAVDGDVEVVEELGRGAHTAVYRVRRAGVEYALKVLDRAGPGDESVPAEFCREAALLARVNHPGVPKIFDVGLTAGHPYLAMELIDGQPLSERLRSGALEVNVLVRLGMDVAAALHAVHAAGLVHRDVKPANIILTDSGQARLIDFGLAAAGRAESRGDAIVGTFDYAAPEQAGMLARPVDGRADLYALGVVLFGCATGQLPFRADDVGELLALHAAAPVPDPRVLRPELPADVAELIVRLLAKDPDDRVPSARELHAALSRSMPGAGVDELATAGPPVGREDEHGRLARCWPRARAGKGGIVLLDGPAGVGKSTLARRVTEAAQADGALVLSGKCDADSPLPLAPLRSAVDGYVRIVAALPAAERAVAVAVLRTAAGSGASLLAPLSPALAALLDAPPRGGEDRREQFAGAVASFLSALAVGCGGLMLLIDDVQWLDPASREVLRRLTEELAEAPFLLLATARNGAAADSFAVDAGARLDLRLPVRPLDDAGAARLIVSYLAGCTVSPEVVAELTARGRGNPLTILEYLHALVDAGALRPSWGTWRLDTDRLQSIDLPTDVVELILARIDGLGQATHETLTVAAALGSRFEPDLLAGVVTADPGPALAEAAGRGLLHADGVGYTFVHDRIREALLSAVGATALPGLHRRIATVLAARGRSDPPHVYALARHCASGGLEHQPERVFTTGRAAGRLALAEHAPDAALSFLQAAAAGAEAAGIAPDSQFREALAVAYLACGDAEGARRQLKPALAAETAPLRRAALLLQLAHVERAGWKLAESTECVKAGLAELGRPLPRRPLLYAIRSLLWWLLAGGHRPARRPAVGEEAERLRLHAMLCRAGSAAAAIGIQAGLTLAFNSRGVRDVHRLGLSSEYATAYAVLGITAGAFRLAGRKNRVFRRLGAIAEELADPALQAFLAWTEAYADHSAGIRTIAQFAEVAEKYRRWLEPDHYLNVVIARARDLTARGYPGEALVLLERGRNRISARDADQFFGLALTDAVARTLLGQEVTAPAALARLGEAGPEQAYAVQIALTSVQLAVEQDQLGQQFERAIAAFDQLRLHPMALFPDQRMIFVAEAFGRLARCRRDAAEVAAASGAVRRLGRLANDPVLRGYHAVARAALREVRGEPARALNSLAKAEKDLVRLDAPLVQFEAARVRARALRALGEDALSRQHADHAALLAGRYGWPRRGRWVQSEFGVAEPVSRRTGSYTRHSDSAGNRYRRRLEALQQVSAAAAAVLDPQRLARVALDETLRILGAERAILFLCGDDGRPRPHLGRTGAGELTELTGYSASLVERVAADHRPLIVTGGDEGAALGSQSTIVHGLRSIMIAPLELDGRLLGVVYLDSRVAKGVFTGEDVDILTAITSQVAVSLETARAAQLEVAVQSARQQRDTAEALREAMSELAATLDPEQVLRVLRDIAARTLAADQVCLLHRDGDELTVAAGAGGRPDGVDAAAALALAGPGCGGAGDVPPDLAPLLDGARSWLVTPLTTPGHGAGVLIAGSSSAGRFGQAELDIAAALAGQGGTAYTNARLFAQVRQLATTDGLTGVFNRRHFTELAVRQLDVAARNHRPMAALMIDIDHFKRVNDTHGHGIGDDVIRAVAGALRDDLREPDVLCRYGGEEFAVILSEMHGDPTAVAERLRAAVAALAVPAPAGPVRPTVSVGVADLKPDDGLDELLARADEALYRAKQAGRNTVISG